MRGVIFYGAPLTTLAAAASAPEPPAGSSAAVDPASLAGGPMQYPGAEAGMPPDALDDYVQEAMQAGPPYSDEQSLDPGDLFGQRPAGSYNEPLGGPGLYGQDHQVPPGPPGQAELEGMPASRDPFDAPEYGGDMCGPPAGPAYGDMPPPGAEDPLGYDTRNPYMGYDRAGSQGPYVPGRYDFYE